MRVFGFLGTVITLAIGMYLYSSQIKTFEPSAAAGNKEDATTIVGVKNDLISIATAERGYQASQGKYASLEELISGNYLTIRSERPPYIYNIEMSGSSFRATATRTTKGSPAQLWIGDDMQVQASD
jgi:20S proteasome alpha/beta subunit